MKAIPAIRRLVRNSVRLPERTAISLRHWFDPNYDLDREAKSRMGWLLRDRLEKLQSIPGMCTFPKCRVLSLLALKAPPGGVIVEIGAWKGRVSAWLIETMEQRPDPLPIISIDPHAGQLGETWDDFCRTVADFKLAERGLQVIRKPSHEAGKSWSQPISFLWIDGGHEYEDVVHDIADYAPHVISGGLIAFDDSSEGLFPGVEQAIAEWKAAARDIEHVATVRDISVFRKVTRS
jgi:predicted O-methyltransferase YrrM